MFTKSISFLSNYQECTLHSVKHTDVAEHQLPPEPSSQQESSLPVFQQCPSGKLTAPTLQQHCRAELNTGSKSRLWEALELILQLDIFLGLCYAGRLCCPFSRAESGRCQVNLSPQLPPAFPRLWIFYFSLKRCRRECHPFIYICYARHYTSIIYTELKSLIGHL